MATGADLRVYREALRRDLRTAQPHELHGERSSGVAAVAVLDSLLLGAADECLFTPRLVGVGARLFHGAF